MNALCGWFANSLHGQNDERSQTWLRVDNLKGRTLIRRARCRRGAGVSFGSWLSLRERRISYRWGSRCQAPTAGQPRGYPRLDSEGSPCTTSACLAKPAGNTWWGCSPKNKRNIWRRWDHEGCWEYTTFSTSLPSLFDPLTLALSILILFFKKKKRAPFRLAFYSFTNCLFSFKKLTLAFLNFLYSIYLFSFYLLYN